jgi:hypothetical protein
MKSPVSGPGRHRAPHARLTLAQRLGAAAVVLGGTGLAAAMWPASAIADAPVQTAWFNAMSGGGQAAPDPATPAGGLHVSVASGQILAFGAVQYALTEGSTATLELKVSNLTATPVVNPTAPTTDPAANIVACPITGTWQGGDDQPMDSAPKYDCTRSVFGSLSADQTTLTFFLDTTLETVPGQLNIAIVPVVTDEIPGAGTPAPADTTQPFSLDLAKPDASSLTVTSTAVVPAAPVPPATTGGTTGKAATSGPPANSSTGASSGSSGVSLPGSLTTDTTSASTDSGTSPVVAPTNTAPAAAPAAATAPAKNDRAHNAALAMLLLIGLGLIAMSSGQMQRAPRLLGGSGRHAALAGAAGAATAAAAPAVPMTPYGNRGLGRFAKPRTEPARPLT